MVNKPWGVRGPGGGRLTSHDVNDFFLENSCGKTSSLKLRAKVPEHRPKPKRKGSLPKLSIFSEAKC